MRRALVPLAALAALLAAGCKPIVFNFGRRPRGPLSRREAAFIRAEREYKRIIARNPEDPAAPATLAAAYHQRGSFADSEKYFKLALKASPRFYAARAGLARLYLDWEKPKPALVEAKLAAEDNPGDAAAFALLARAHEANGQGAEALAALKKGLDLDPENVDLLLRLARLHFREKRLAEALALCRRALKCEPENPHVLADLALMLTADDPREAVKYALAAVKLPGAGAAHWEVLGRAQGAVKAGPDGEAAYRQAIKLEPDQVSARRRLAELLEKTGRPAEALAEYRQAVRCAPRQREMLERAAGLARRLDRRGDELALRLQLAQAFPKDVTAGREAARALERAGAPARAIGRWEQVLALSKGDLEAHRALARLWRRLGKAGTATVHYMAVLQADAKDADALEGLAALAVEERRFKEARKHYENLVKAHPGRARGRAMLGLVLAELGEPDAAARELRAALNVDEKLPIAHRELADVLRKIREPKAALKHAERATQLAPRDPKAWVVLARVHKAAGRKKQTAAAYARAFDEAARLAPGSAEVTDIIWAAAEAAEQAKEPAKAAGFYLRLTADARTRAAGARQLARLAGEAKKPGDELYWLRAALLAGSRKAPWRARVRARAAQLYREAQAVTGALALYWKDLARDPHDFAALAGLGALEARRGQYLNAARSFERLQAARPRSRQAAAALVSIYGRLGRRRKALGAALRLVAIDPENSEARFACARVYRQLGKRQREELALRAAVKLDAKNAAAHNALGVLLAATDRLAEARGHLKRAAECAPKAAWPVHNLAVLAGGKDINDPEMAARYRAKVADMVKRGAEPPPKDAKGSYWIFVPQEDW